MYSALFGIRAVSQPEGINAFPVCDARSPRTPGAANPSSMMLLCSLDCCGVKKALCCVQAACLLLHGFCVALKSFPLLVPLIMHVDPGCFLSAPLYRCLLIVSDFNFLFSLLFLLTLPLYFQTLPPFLLIFPFAAWDSGRKVALELCV